MTCQQKQVEGALAPNYPGHAIIKLHKMMDV